jgi:hypothetical protein
MFSVRSHMCSSTIDSPVGCPASIGVRLAPVKSRMGSWCLIVRAATLVLLLLFAVALPGRGSRSIVAPCIMSTRHRSSFSLCNKLVASSAEPSSGRLPRTGQLLPRGLPCWSLRRTIMRQASFRTRAAGLAMHE